MKGARTNLRRVGWFAGLGTTFAVLCITALAPVWLVQAREAVFDSYQRLHPRVADPAAPVHVVLIDEAALETFGQWPWPRTYLGELSDRLFALGAVAVGFDILLVEADRMSPDALLESWQRFDPPAHRMGDSSDHPMAALRQLPDNDSLLADQIAGRPVVLGVAGGPTKRSQTLRPKAGIARTGTEPVAGITSFPGALLPRPVLAEAAAGLGVVSLGRNDTAGVTRAIPMVSRIDGVLWPSLTAELLRVAQGAGGHVLRTAAASGLGSGGQTHPVDMRSGAAIYPLDRAGRFRIHFAGPADVRQTSARDILTGPEASSALAPRIAGKLVLVGASAQALFDIHATPLANVVPGVSIQAEVLEQIVAGHFLKRPDWMLGLELLVVALTGALLTAISLGAAPLTGLLLWAGVVGALGIAGWAAFVTGGLLFDPLPALGTALLVYIPLTTVSVVSRERARARIRNSFAHFLPDAVISELSDNQNETLAPLGTDCEITVIFIDMRGFTRITEHMAPQDVVSLLNTLLGAMADTLVRHGATIDKFIGDAIMAFWNAPLPQADHKAQALAALVALQTTLERVNRDFADRDLPPVNIRVGINAGVAFVGLLGSAKRLNYSAIGDCVTVAARLEALTRRYGVDNLVGEAAITRLPAALVAVWLGEVTVRGREATLRIATLLGRDARGTDAFAAACDAYHARLQAADWPGAQTALTALKGVSVAGVDTDTLSGVYAEQLARRRSEPLRDQADMPASKN